MGVNNKKSFFIFTAILVVSLVLLNLISRNWFFRWDLTDNQRYSLSESSRSVVEKVEDLLTMKVYFSDNLPGEYGNNRRYLHDILEEYAAFSNGNIRFEFFKPETDKDLEQDAQKSGIQPVQLQVVENDKVEIKRVFMGMIFLYEDQKEVIPVIQSTAGLEYEITTRIKKLVDTDKKVIGVANLANDDVKMENVSMALSQRYRVNPVNLDQEISGEINTLLLTGTSDTLSADVRTNLEGFVAKGGNLFIAQAGVQTDIQTQQATAIESDLLDMLRQYGLSIQPNLVMDRKCGRVSVQQNMGFIRMNVPMEYPFLPIVQTFNDAEPVVSGLEQLQLLFPSEIISIDSLYKNANVTSLFTSSNRSGAMSGSFNLNPDPKQNPAFRSLNEKGKVLAALSKYTHKATELISQIILVADSKFFADDGGGASPENQIFTMNAVDYLTGDSELISLRSREITIRPLEEIEDDARSRWKWMNIVLPSLLIVGFGFLRMKKEAKRAKILEEIYG